MSGTRLSVLVLTALLAFAGARAGLAASGKIDFNRDIRPLLSDRCFACHGPDDKQRKAGLRLDERDSALRPAKSGAIAIVPGKPDQSEFLARLTTADADDRMPPAETGKTLTPAQIDLLKRWIEEGAEYRAHWAFVPPKRPTVPEGTGGAAGAGPANPIDAFVAARLAEEKLTMSPEADRATLARRTALDLTGLPPTPEELDAFLSDPSPKAYEQWVDRLLESPRYGERMAVEWLDASRYADTHGYHLDSGRDMTAWRDGVIRAFNENQRFDQFTVEQLAGDLLPNATQAQKIASGFNRNHMINYEGGAIAEEYHYAYLVDRVNTTGTVWLGLTVACAQCHDHKYDPISMADFYRLFAFFNNVPERGLDGNKGNAAPVLRLTGPDSEARLAELNRAVEEVESRLKGPLPEVDAAQEAWERASAGSGVPVWTRLEPTGLRGEGGAEFRRQEDGSFLVTGPNPESDVYRLAFTQSLPAATGLRLEVLADDSLGAKGPGRAANGNFVLGAVAVKRSTGGDGVKIKAVSADFSQKGYPVEAILDDRPETGWAVDGGIGKPHAAVLEFEAPLGPGDYELILEFRSGFANHAIGRFALGLTASPNPRASDALPDRVRVLLAKAATDRSAEEAGELRGYFREKVSPEYRRLRDQASAARKARDEFEASIPTTMVMAEMNQPRDTFVYLRGQYDKKGDKVTAGTPASLPPFPAGEPMNRLGFARWLVSPEHPLTARVTVNRYWQMFFGTGLVKTAEDFGSQGEWPSHPELLDWLAREFVESGWDVKRLHRLILTSASYRQSSRVSPELAHRDPENRLLARGPRFRLQAEFIRDQALAVSGLLNGQIGGKSVSPYQPPGLWEELSMREDSKNFSAQFFVQSKGADLYRRSMYTFLKRSSPPPQMSTFDAPDRETCTVRRPRTNTPLQALILLNDPTYVEASRKLAERLMARSGSDADRVAWAFRLATARSPSRAETEVLLRVLEQQRAHYRARREAADDLLSNGEAPRDLTLDAAELAAWTMVSSTILNLDETVTKG